MKPEYVKITIAPKYSFSMKKVVRPERPVLKGAWHFHPEIEITLTLKSSGKRFIGNDISEYDQGDLVMVGKNIPHCWLTKEKTEQVVIQMAENFEGGNLFKKPEMLGIHHLFLRCQTGMVFKGKTRKAGKRKILEMCELKGFFKLMALLDLLHFLARSKECRYLTNRYRPNLNMKTSQRVQLLYYYISNNFQKDISLEKAAGLINMTKSSFCKFIKKATKKTFSQIVNEIRIEHACYMLDETDINISQICYECGYHDLSYFNRRFKEIMKVKPIEFRSRFLETSA